MLRSALSALGVIIAVAAVIAMTEIGEGSKVTLQKSIAGMGANTLDDPFRGGVDRRSELRRRQCDDLDALRTATRFSASAPRSATWP